MTAQWEYAVVRYSITATPGGPPASAEYRIYLAGGSEPETRRAEDEWALLHMLTEMGAQGWELVVSTVSNTTIGGPYQGFESIGYPVAMSWTFKRLAAQQTP
jgi:hypothetical protein